MNPKKLNIILAILVIGCSFIFFVLGAMFATYNIIQIADSIKVEQLTISFNETKIVDAMMKNMDDYRKWNEEILDSEIVNLSNKETPEFDKVYDTTAPVKP